MSNRISNRDWVFSYDPGKQAFYADIISNRNLHDLCCSYFGPTGDLLRRYQLTVSILDQNPGMLTQYGIIAYEVTHDRIYLPLDPAGLSNREKAFNIARQGEIFKSWIEENSQPVLYAKILNTKNLARMLAGIHTDKKLNIRHLLDSSGAAEKGLAGLIDYDAAGEINLTRLEEHCSTVKAYNINYADFLFATRIAGRVINMPYPNKQTIAFGVGIILGNPRELSFAEYKNTSLDRDKAGTCVHEYIHVLQAAGTPGVSGLTREGSFLYHYALVCLEEQTANPGQDAHIYYLTNPYEAEAFRIAGQNRIINKNNGGLGYLNSDAISQYWT